MVASTLTQFAVSSLSPFLIRDLGLTRTRFGVLAATVFLVGGLAAPVMGVLVDRIGGRRTYVVLFASAILGWLGMAVSTSFAWAMLAVACGGVAAGGGNPVTNHLVMRHLPRGEQGAVMGVKQSGPQAAAIATGLMLPFGAARIGWRWALVATTALLLLAAYKSVRVIPRSDALRGRRRGDRPGTAERSTVRWIAVHSFFMGVGISSVWSYVPLYAFELGFDERVAGTTVLCIGLVGLPALLYGGRLAERWQRVSGPLTAFAVGSAACVLVMALAEHSASWLVWLASIGFAVTAVPWHVVGMVAIIRRVDIARAGRASGVVLMGFNAGLVASPIVFGWTVDHTGGYALGWLATSVAFAVAAAVSWLWRITCRREALP
jgi:predicted MFS family arabinose efflux permease